MEIREVGDNIAWDRLVHSQPDYTFLNAWAWGEFQQAMGNKVWRLGVYEDEELAGMALVILVAARRGRFLFVPHGPIFNFQFSIFNKFSNHNFQTFKIFLEYLKSIAQQESCSFIRISPLLLRTPENEKIFRDLKFHPAPMHMHAETTWVLDTTPPEEALLKNMRKTTRYLVRRGEKEGVEVISGNDERLLRDFYELYMLTSRRQRFTPFSYEYVAKEVATFGPNAQIYLASHQGKIFSGAVVMFYGERAFYHHGASLHHPTASYLLQWRIIQDLKARGIKEYNFWGVDFRPNHPWAGVTLFKTGFGGQSRAYLPAQDVSLRPTYWFSYGIETLRRFWRRY